ncbi:hypothetical protein EC957_010478, partial [Mortierella hygrophila]
IEPKVSKCGDDDVDDSQKDSDDLDTEGKGNKHAQFLQTFLTYLYPVNLPNKNSKIGKAVDIFISILAGLQLFDICRNRNELNEGMLFTASSLVRSVTGQLSVELKKMDIQENISAAENYIAFNDLIPNSWRLAPITSSQQPFVTFSEPPLSSLLRISGNWIGGLEPGVIIKSFVCDIDPTGLSSRQKHKTGHCAAISLRSLSEIRDHLQFFKQAKLKEYHQKGYIPHGSIRTDGFRVQILTFKLRERQDARFRRLPEDDLPPRLTTTVAGSDYYLPEIRNVIQTKEDIDKL